MYSVLTSAQQCMISRTLGLKGEGTITDNEGNTIKLAAGESLLVPATTETLKVEGTLKFLETYV